MKTPGRIAVFACVSALALVALVLLCFESRGQATNQELAAIEYEQVRRLGLISANADFTVSAAQFHIVSKLAHVGADDISLFIERKGGRIPVAISTRGWFTLPFSNELSIENPEIVSNQPKCTLSVECSVTESYIQLPEGRSLAYRSLVEHDLLTRSIGAIIEGAKECSFPRVFSGRLDPPGVGSVSIRTAKATKKIPVDRESGFFQIPLSPELMEENPLVVFQPASTRVYLVESCGMPRTVLAGRVAEF